MTSQERIKAILAHKEPDRIGKHDHFWWQAVQHFREQGLPENTAPEDYFDLDIRRIGTDSTFQLPVEIIEETDEHIIKRTEWGTIERTWKKSQSTPEFLEFACTSRDKWFGEYRERQQPNETRLGFDFVKECYEYARARGRYFCISCSEVFEATWRMVGPAKQLELLIDDPEWLTDMYKTHTDLVIWAFEELWSRGIEFDGMWVWGDIAYRSGPFMSPRMYRELIMPHHKRLFDAAHSKGCEVIYHGDGNNNMVIPDLIDAGVDCLQPIEVKAGMDVRELKAKYGDKLSFMGNIDARLLQTNDKDALANEIKDKITIAKQGGGYVYHSDHSVPPGTDLDTYRFVIECVEEYGRY